MGCHIAFIFHILLASKPYAAVRPYKKAQYLCFLQAHTIRFSMLGPADLVV